VVSNGIAFIPGSVKIGQLVQKLKWDRQATHRHHGLSHKATFFL